MKLQLIKIAGLLRKSHQFSEIVGIPGFLRLLWMEILAKKGEAYELKVRQLGGRSIRLRTGTSDHSTLLPVFKDTYHSAPASLPGKSSVILDLGCNAGYTTAHLASLYPGARIIGVEMDVGNYELAKSNVAGLENCRILNLAIAAADGTVSYRPDVEAVAYRIDRNAAHTDGSGEISVKAVRIDTLMRDLKIESVDYVKMDIEGEEVEIFDGSEESLRWLDHTVCLNVEVHTGDGALRKIIGKLEDRGFTAWKDKNHWAAVLATRNRMNDPKETL